VERNQMLNQNMDLLRISLQPSSAYERKKFQESGQSEGSKIAGNRKLISGAATPQSIEGRKHKRIFDEVHQLKTEGDYDEPLQYGVETEPQGKNEFSPISVKPRSVNPSSNIIVYALLCSRCLHC
jgi:5-methylcytosine-specific restriction endonuclease McrBC regulatory subunit McrC